MEQHWRVRTHISSAAVVLCLSLFLVTALPASGQSTVRYLNAVSGSDTAECLSDSPLPIQSCRTLRYALAGNGTSISNLSLLIWPGTYVYGETSTVVARTRNLLIQKMPGSDGEVIFQCINYSEDQYNNLAIFSAENVTIMGITFEQCGPFSSGIFMDDSRGILVSQCTFRSNSGGGIAIFNVHSAHITNCTFVNNTVTRADLLSNITTFNFRAYTAGGLAITFNGTTGASILVSNCTFVNNTASVNELNANDPRPQGYAPFGRGGAMAVLITNYSSHNVLNIQKCKFYRNSAKYTGGSIYIPIFKSSQNNSVVISNSTFKDCTANATGGAISVDIFDVAENNTVEVVDSNFYTGRAWFGGGAMSIVLQDSLASSARIVTSVPVVTMSRCTFERNYSPTGGSAVGMVSNARVDQLSFIVAVSDCNFTENQASNQSAVFTFRLPFILMGTNIFHGNIGGAVYLLQTSLDAKGTVLFENNTASQGGAVTFEDLSVINLHSGTKVIFRGNRAELVGGAILVDNPTLIRDTNTLFNALCFLQYEMELENAKNLIPRQWENSS